MQKFVEHVLLREKRLIVFARRLDTVRFLPSCLLGLYLEISCVSAVFAEGFRSYESDNL